MSNLLPPVRRFLQACCVAAVAVESGDMNTDSPSTPLMPLRYVRCPHFNPGEGRGRTTGGHPPDR